VKVNVKLIFRTGAHIELRLLEENPYEWTAKTVDNLSVAAIRDFARKLPETFMWFFEEIESRNVENQKVIDTIAGILKKVC